MASKKYTLNRADMSKWFKNTLLFSTPTLLIFLTTLQTRGDLDLAIGAAYSALLSSGIDLLKKYVSS